MSEYGETATQAVQSAPLLGFWYPALLSKTVRPGHMQAQTILELPLVICRDSQGAYCSAARPVPTSRYAPLVWPF